MPSVPDLIGARVVDTDDRVALITRAEAESVELRLDDGALIWVPRALMHVDGDHYRLDVPLWAVGSAGEVAVAVAEEDLHVHRRPVVRGGVRIERTVETHTGHVDETVEHMHTAVERLPIDRFVERPPLVRREGDRLIVPVVEEVLVVEKRLRLVEEIHIVEQRRTEQITESHPLRRAHVEVSFLDAADVSPRPGHTSGAPSKPGRHPPPRTNPEVHMSKTLVALYPTPQHARDAIRSLHGKDGVDFSHVSVIAHNAEGEFERLTEEKPDTKVEEGNLAAEGAGAGATAGAVIGGIAGLLVGLGVFILPGVGAIVAAGPIATTLAGAGVGAAAGGLIGALVGLGIPEKEAEYYAEGVRRGGVLLVVRTTDDAASDIADVLDSADPLDIEEAGDRWRKEGWSGYDAKAEPYDEARIREIRARYRGTGAGTTAATARTGSAAAARTPTAPATATTGAAAATAAGARLSAKSELKAGEEQELEVPVVEEEMDIGKRPVLRGAVRVRRYVTEVPVKEKVHTREEHVDVERKAVDRPVRPGDAAFVEGTVEVTEMTEEVVAEKRARVKEEVRVSKDVEHHVETVEDTVRRADVEVEKVATGTVRGEVEHTKHVEASAAKAKKQG